MLGPLWSSAKIFIIESAIYWAGFIFTLIGWLTIAVLFHVKASPGHHDFSEWMERFFALPAFLLGRWSGHALGRRKTRGSDRALINGSLAFAIVNMAGFWPDEHESYSTLAVGALITLCFTLAFVMNYRSVKTPSAIDGNDTTRTNVMRLRRTRENSKLNSYDQKR